MHTALYGGICVVFMYFLLAFRNLELYHISFNLQIFWYRQGDMDNKFKKLIYYNAFCLTLLCVCANIYFHGVKV